MRIFVAVATPFGEEWQVEVDLSSCRGRIHRRGIHIATVRYGDGQWLDLEPDSDTLRAVLAEAGKELRPFSELLRNRCPDAVGSVV